MRVQIKQWNPDANNSTLYVEYEKVGDEWVMRQWRIGFDAKGYPNGRLEGEWHKLNGRRKRPIGHMPIRTRTLHLYYKGSNCKVELIGK